MKTCGCGCGRPVSGRRVYASDKCRVYAWRERQRGVTTADVTDAGNRNDAGAVTGPGCAPRAAEVDHRILINTLELHYNGWALSTDPASLASVLRWCADDVRVAAWTWPNGRRVGAPRKRWEPVIYRPARRPDGVEDVHTQAPPGASLTGAKPVAFGSWVLELLGARPGDSLCDCFPGSGRISRAGRLFGLEVSQPSHQHPAATA